MGKYSQYRGVTWNKRRQLWVAQMFIAGPCRAFGYFNEEEEAALLADNIRLYLQEFIQEPLDLEKLNFGTEKQTGPSTVAEDLRRELEREGAPKFRQNEGKESREEELEHTIESAVALLTTVLLSLKDSTKPRKA